MKNRKLSVWILLVILLVGGAGRARAEKPGEGETHKEPGRNTTSTDLPTDDKAAPISTEAQLLLLQQQMEKMESMFEEKIRRLERMIEAQQQELTVLRGGVAPALTPKLENGAGGATDIEVAAAMPAVNPAVVSAQQPKVDEMARKVEKLWRGFGPFSLSGDLRFRVQTINNLGFDGPFRLPDRTLVRGRLRLQLTGQFHKNFEVGVRLSSGNSVNPLSVQNTFTDFFNRKPVNLDRYYVRYDSGSEPVGVILQGGRFDYPWKRTELTFDNDLQPEGAAETIYYKGKGKLKDIRLIAFQLPFNEVPGGKDSVLYGGQVQSTITVKNWNFINSATFLNFNQTDAVAAALGVPPTQIGGGLDTQNPTNRVRRNAQGKIIGFVSNFNILDLISEVNYTGFGRWPVTLILNYARNMSGRLDKFGERDAFWSEFRIGRIKEQGDIELSYTFIRVEQDAVLGVFNFSNMLATNSRSSRITAAYTINSNVFFRFITILSQRFNAIPGRENRTMRSLFFDATYRF